MAPFCWMRKAYPSLSMALYCTWRPCIWQLKMGCGVLVWCSTHLCKFLFVSSRLRKGASLNRHCVKRSHRIVKQRKYRSHGLKVLGQPVARAVWSGGEWEEFGHVSYSSGQRLLVSKGKARLFLIKHLHAPGTSGWLARSLWESVLNLFMGGKPDVQRR